MNIAVDYGNTTAKVGIFKEDTLLEKHHFSDEVQLRSFFGSHPAENAIVSSVAHPAEEVLSWVEATKKKIVLSYRLPLPVRILYVTPQTLGVDRIAGACGAVALFPNQPCLVIDAGTCVNYEFVDAERNYHGGAISPGIAMRFEAMHKFTSRLPLVPAARNTPLVGNSTESSLQSGVINGVRAEVEGIIQRYRNTYPDTRVILCGGDASFFDNLEKQTIFVAPDLVLLGLNSILAYNINHRH